MAVYCEGEGEGLSWSADLEVSLFHSMKGHKPVGINRFFHMACIHDKFSTTSGRKDVTSKQLWEHLEEMYNLDALNEIEGLPFPNEEAEFSLPEELTNPEQSAPPSPATSVEDTPVVQRPTNLKLSTFQATLGASSPDSSVSSPKRKRTRGPGLSSSQPSSPAPATTGSKGRRR